VRDQIEEARVEAHLVPDPVCDHERPLVVDQYQVAGTISGTAAR
jgi:hypothetical protein